MASLGLTERLGCDDLVHLVSETVHRARMREVLVDLLERPGIFEAALGCYDDDTHSLPSDGVGAEDDDDRPIRELRNMGHEVRVRHDDYIYWWTTVVHIDDSRFVMMHEYCDCGSETYVVEGFVEEGMIKLERIQISCGRSNAASMDELVLVNKGGNCIYNLIPFQFVMEHYGGPVEFDFTYDSGKAWKHPERAWRWFEQTRWHRAQARRT